LHVKVAEISLIISTIFQLWHISQHRYVAMSISNSLRTYCAKDRKCVNGNISAVLDLGDICQQLLLRKL